MTEFVPMHRSVARVSSRVFAGIGVAMVFCAFLGFAFENSTRPARAIDAGSVPAMLISAAVVLGCAGLIYLWGRPAQGVAFTRREAAVTVSAIWFGVSVFGAIPYMLDAHIPFTAAFFEAASGFTTTGATIIEDIEGTMSHTLLLWRSLTQWLGGMGIVVLFVAVFPSLGVSGKHMYRSEVPGHSAEGLQPRIAETSLALWRFYMAFTVAETIALWFLGMDVYEAVNHAWTTMSTGGFSTRNASIAAFDSPAIEIVISLFMLAAGMNFGLYYAALLGGVRKIGRSIEFRVYLVLTVVSTSVIALMIPTLHGGDWLESFRIAFFTVATTITSTGYGVDDYMAYPSVALMVILGLMLVGGMSGSTAGGIKVSRLVILAETSWAMIRRSVRPQVVHVIRLDRKALDEELLLEVATFFFLYIGVLGSGMMIVAVTDGVPPPTLLGATLSALSNMGPAPYYIEADNFARYTPVAKLVFGVVMLMGRLELLTVLALFLPDVWRR